MSELMKYIPELTREFYRAIVRHDDEALLRLRTNLRACNGTIGNAQFVDLDIRDGEEILCERHRLRLNDDHFTDRAHELDAKHDWDADGIWIPYTKEDSQPLA